MCPKISTLQNFFKNLKNFCSFALLCDTINKTLLFEILANLRGVIYEQKPVIAFVSVVLAEVIAVGGIWFFFFKKGNAEGAPIDVSRLTLAGDPLLNTVLSSVTAGAVPDGWFCEDVFSAVVTIC